MKTKQIFSFLFFLLLFVALFWFVDVRFIRMLARQYQAQSFPSVKGEIMSGEVVQWTGSKGTVHYHPSFTYRYEVNGHAYLGKRSRYDGHPSFYNYDEANQVVVAHPKGSEVDVYYNPNNPKETVLSPSLDAQDVGLVFLFAPFNLLFLSILIKTGQEIDWPGKTKPIAGGVRIITDRMTTRVRLPVRQPVPIGLWTAGFLSFVVGIIFQHVCQSYPPVSTGLLTLIGIIVVGFGVYLWFRRKVESGLQDLVIDEGARMIELPLTYKRRDRAPLAFADIEAVTLEKVAHRRRAGVTYTYAPTLQIRNGSPQPLTDLNQERAESFAVWLQEKFGMKVDANNA